MNVEKTLKEYLDDLSSNSPTPGGGNVAALCGVLSSSLGTMVCNLTIGKKKYAEVEQEIISVKSKLEDYKERFITLAAKDNEAFDKVMDAFKLPKDNDEQKNIRIQKIDEATFAAAEVPDEVIKICKELLPLIKTTAEKGNQNSLSDAGVAALLTSTAAQGAYLNVLINCMALKNQTIAGEVLKSAEIRTEEIKEESSSILENIKRRLLS